MAEGGLFPWKTQKIIRYGPTADYSSICYPLPDTPEGMVWFQNKETREWKLVPEVDDFVMTTTDKDRMVHGGETTTKTTTPNEAKEDDGEDWEVLSDKVSLGSLGGGGILVSRGGASGSVRSIASMDTMSIPFRVQRTLSSSTIDSEADGGSITGGTLGVDYVEHIVLPTDTLQGLCLAYKINATRIRQANHFSGNSLFLAPKKLMIPLTKKALRTGFIRVQDKDSRDYKIHAFLAEVPSSKETEAKAYLELADWIVEDAVQSAREDGEWEKEVQDERKPQSGDIRITLNVHEGIPVGFRATGAGLVSSSSSSSPRTDMTIYEGVPAIATKSVRPQDVYHAAPQHGGFGLEMQPLVGK